MLISWLLPTKDGKNPTKSLKLSIIFLGQGKMVAEKESKSVDTEMNIEASTTGVAGKVGRDQIINNNHYYGNEQLEKHVEKQEEKEVKKGRLAFVITGNLEDGEISRATLELIVEELKEGGFASLKIKTVEKGSIKIILEGDGDELERLKKLFASGELQKVQGIAVEEVHSLNEEEEKRVNEKLRLVEEISTSKRVNQSKANLQGANLQGANLQGANLRKANLQGANLEEANLEEANLGGANLGGANLQLAYLRKANLQRANLQGAYLQLAKLQLANLQGVYLEEANLQGVYLEEANLQGANLQLANLQRANLRRAYLPGANLQGVDMEEAYLPGAYLQGAYLQGAYLRRAYLPGAYLRRANLEEANLQRANLQRANLRKAYLKEALFGNNQGISREMKTDLIRRGAIFIGSPGSGDRVLAPR